MTVLDVAAAHYGQQRAITAAVTAGMRAEWAKVNVYELDASFIPVLNRLIALMVAGQLAAAGQADTYVRAAVAAQDLEAPSEGDLDPRGFAGQASDGRPLGSLLSEPKVAAKSAWVNGSSPAEVSAAGLASLVRITATEIADAGRVADGVAIASRPRVTGYVRMLTPPSCARCAVLAGRWYRWNSGFQRHPHCDCRHIPAIEDASGDLRTDPMAALRSGQVTDLSKADTRAILESGADMNQVVNARRGMYTAGGRKFTTEGTTKRGIAGKRRPGGQRLRPEQILKDAENRADAIRLLRSHGYIF